jgi:PKD repeat protein
MLGYQDNIARFFKKNEPPVARLKVTPSEGNSKTTFTMDASESSDNEDGSEQLQVRWDFESNPSDDANVGMGDWSHEKTTSHQYAAAGKYFVRLTVKDSQGLENSLLQEITIVANTPPKAVLIYQASQHDFFAYEFDALSCKDKEDSLDQLEVSWDFNGDGQWDSEYSKKNQLTYRFPAPGVYNVILEVKDSGGLKQQAKLLLQLKATEIRLFTHKRLIDRRARKCLECHHPDANKPACRHVEKYDNCMLCHQLQASE